MKNTTLLIDTVLSNSHNNGLMSKWINGATNEYNQGSDRTITNYLFGVSPHDPNYRSEKAIAWFIMGTTARLLREGMICEHCNFGTSIARLVKSAKFSESTITMTINRIKTSSSVVDILSNIGYIVGLCINANVKVDIKKLAYELRDFCKRDYRIETIDGWEYSYYNYDMIENLKNKEQNV